MSLIIPHDCPVCKTFNTVYNGYDSFKTFANCVSRVEGTDKTLSHELAMTYVNMSDELRNLIILECFDSNRNITQERFSLEIIDYLSQVKKAGKTNKANIIFYMYYNEPAINLKKTMSEIKIPNNGTQFKTPQQKQSEKPLSGILTRLSSIFRISKDYYSALSSSFYQDPVETQTLLSKKIN